MAISMIERHGSWYEIYDERGKKQKTVSEQIGMVLGCDVTPKSWTVKHY